MKRVLLLRHAKSSWDDPSLDDIERPLNKRGRRAASAMAQHFRDKGLRPEIVLCSPAVRTRQTLDLLLPALGDAPIQFDDRIYDAAMQTLLARLLELPDKISSVLIVGHNPGLERLAQALDDGQGDPRALARLKDKYPTGTLTLLDSPLEQWAAFKSGSCRLVDFVSPSDLAAG